MSRISEVFVKLREKGKTAFIPFITAGDPELETTISLVLALERAGANLVELGIPFSDSIADGPTIQKANERALASGTTVKKVFAMLKKLREKTDIPILLMGSYNPLVIYGVDKFCQDAVASGADGLIIADLLPDNAGELLVPASASGLDTVFLVARTSTVERFALVNQKSSGFVYAVSLTGVTGERDKLPADLAEFLASVRKKIDLPICVGFGLSTPEMVKDAAQYADGIIVGSALVKRIANAGKEGKDPCQELYGFAASLTAVL